MNCASKRAIQRAIDILQQGGSEGPNTVLVSGSCKENITIQSMDNLTLTAQNGASITDPSHGNLDVIDIVDSRRVSINGFTINGGAVGVRCGNYSLCRFNSNTIQNADPGVLSNASQASFAGDTLETTGNAAGIDVFCNQQFSAGVTLVNGDSLTVQGNGGRKAL
jgi:hypothetical protein